MEYNDIESNRRYLEQQVVKTLYWVLKEPGFNEYTGEDTDDYWAQVQRHLLAILEHACLSP